MLDGSGLQIRELDYELVITNPNDPDQGRIYVAFADGYVSRERVAWDYLGPLEGFGRDGEPQIGANKIIRTLAPE